jgi:hypothetical protein
VSDQDPIFTWHFQQELFRLANVKLHLSSAFHLQSDEQSEAANKITAMYLRYMVGDRQRCWLKWLSWAKFCYNTSVQASLKASPFQVVYDKDLSSLRAYILGEACLPAVDGQLKEMSS